jgi:formylglycine-generating enzyme required for sulfatase activity
MKTIQVLRWQMSPLKISPMKIHKIFCAAFIGLTLAVGSAHSQFVLTPLPDLPGVFSGSVAWGDYDNDGRMDFLLSGSDGATGLPKLLLWQNTGSGFSNVTASVAPGLPGVFDSSVAWGDFDNDGRLDFLITGLTNLSSSVAVSQVWRNTGSDFTNMPVPGLPGVAQGSAAWSDFDNDGRLDFLITGSTNGNSSGAISQLWRNTGDGFTDVPVPGLTGVYFGSAAWGDFDNDGKPDFLITGITNGASNDAISQLWRNTGNGFTSVPIPGLRGVFVSSVAWGDHDNDGLLDFLLEGLSANGFISQLWRNTGNGFTNVPIPGLPGIADGSLAWADYDSDGRLDFLITGLANGVTRVSQVWRNTGSGFTNVSVPDLPGSFDNSLAWGDYDNDGRLDFVVAGTIEGGSVSQLWRNDVTASNSPPLAPAGLSSIVTGSTVVLRWSPPADDHTPTAGLSYNVRIGTTPGGSDIVSAPALTNGGLLAPRTGTARNDSTAIHNLTPGQTYYWSVQAVDTSFAGSPFATEQEFSTSAQEVSIPDPGLNAAIRDALQKPIGPLTQQDLLSLTNLDAGRRNVRSIVGLEAARNLVSLDLQSNDLTNFSLPSELTKLTTLDVSVNPLANFFLPNGLTNLTSLTLESAGLTNLTLTADLARLKSLDLFGNRFTRFDALSNLTGLVFLDLSFNLFRDFSLPRGLTNLTTFLIRGNPLTNITLPEDLTALNDLHLDQNQFTSFTLPAGLTNLLVLNLFFNQLTNLDLPADLENLLALDLDHNQLSSLKLPPNLTRLTTLHLRANQFTSFVLPAELTGLRLLDVSDNPLTNITLPAGLNRLATLRLSENKLTSLTLPVGMTNLVGLNLTENQLTNLVLPPDLYRLESLDVGGNQLTSLTLPAGLINLVGLFFVGNQLTNLTLPPDMTQLIGLGFLANPLATVVLPETLAATNLAGDVAALRSQGVTVFTYPLGVQLVRPQMFTGRLQFGITGPPGVYTVLGSPDLAAWSVVGTANNPLGSINFNDVTVNLSPAKFYRAQRFTPPTNMVFVPPNTFTMGSPIDELHRQTNEGPQTVVSLSRGFWIGKYEVTQGEYLSITSTNPSAFPEDLSRPVSSVSWPDATNYCWRLTQQELAAGRIPAGSQYRLPTEAEWECAARAGTTSRFSYGDDSDYTSLTNYAWQNFEDGLTVHSVGQKLPNPWGLYDTAGNVFEWCQDWLGPLPGGSVTDPQGPPSNPIGWKIMRGGAFDFGGAACRSASRSFFPNHPALTDWNLGFRVVLVSGP